MRIGMYDPYLDDAGGGEKYMLTIADCLQYEHDIDIFWDNSEEYNFAKKRFNLALKKVNLVPNLFKKGLLNKLLKTHEYDVIIVLSDGSIPVSFSKKLFLHIQRPIANFGQGTKNKIKLRKVNKIFVNSEFTKHYIDKDAGLNSLVIYPPVDIKIKKAIKENIILHVGRFRIVDKTAGEVLDYKKQNVMVDVFKNIVRKLLGEWKFVMAVSVRNEDVGEFEKLKNKARHYPIKFVVNNTNEELWNLYSKSKIYWHASGFGEDLEKYPEAAEHFGISTVEAMGAGVVPVVINAGGQKEIVNDGVTGLLWNDLGEFENKTIELTRNNDLWKKLSKNAQKRSKDFSPATFTEEIKKLVSGYYELY